MAVGVALGGGVIVIIIVDIVTVFKLKRGTYMEKCSIVS